MEKETLSYLKLFEFIKNNGNKELLKFIEEYNNIKDQNIIDLFIFENIDLLKKLLKDNKKIIELLRNIKTRLPIENNCFKQNIEKSINNIDLYINNTNLLHSLNIDKIKFPDKRLIFTFHLQGQNLHKKVLAIHQHVLALLPEWNLTESQLDSSLIYLKKVQKFFPKAFSSR